jgi:hypothetical protein
MKKRLRQMQKLKGTPSICFSVATITIKSLQHDSATLTATLAHLLLLLLLLLLLSLLLLLLLSLSLLLFNILL